MVQFTCYSKIGFYSLAQLSNMALQAVHTSGSRSCIITSNAVTSVLAGSNIYWSEPQEERLLEWEK